MGLFHLKPNAEIHRVLSLKLVLTSFVSVEANRSGVAQLADRAGVS